MSRLLSNPRVQLGTVIGVLIVAGSLWAQPRTNNENKGRKTWVVINNGSASTLKSGSDPQTVEAVKTFAQRCPDVGVTLDKEKADFSVLVGHDPYRPWWRRDNKIAVFDRNGNEIFSTSTRTMGNAVQDACRVITATPHEAESSMGRAEASRE